MKWGVAAVFLAAWLQLDCAKPLPPVPDVPMARLDTDVRDAIEKARAEALAQPKSGQASGRLGMVLEAHTLDQPAVLAFERAVRLEPKEFAWRYYLALSQRQTGQLDQALAAIGDALRIQPDYAPAVRERGELLLRLGRFKEASAALEPLLARDANAPLVLYDLGRIRFAQQDYAAAADFYRRATQADPQFGAAWFGLAESGKRLGNRAESEKDYQLAESYKDHSPSADDPLLAEVLKQATGIQSRLNSAKALQDRREFDRASQLYREVLKQYPDNIESLVNLLYIAQFPNQATPQEAEDLYNKARAANPGYALVYLYHGTALASQGKYDQAVAEIEKGIRLKPNDAEGHAWLADVRERQNRRSDAIAEYQVAVSLKPDFRQARMELAKNMMYAGRSKEVIFVLLPVLQIEDSNTPVAMMFLAQAYLNTGDRSSARKYLNDARDFVLRHGPSALLPQIEEGLRTLGAG